MDHGFGCILGFCSRRVLELVLFSCCSRVRSFIQTLNLYPNQLAENGSNVYRLELDGFTCMLGAFRSTQSFLLLHSRTLGFPLTLRTRSIGVHYHLAPQPKRDVRVRHRAKMELLLRGWLGGARPRGLSGGKREYGVQIRRVHRIGCYSLKAV